MQQKIIQTASIAITLIAVTCAVIMNTSWQNTSFPQMKKVKLADVAAFSFQEKKSKVQTTLENVEHTQWRKADELNFGLRFDECWIKFQVKNEGNLPEHRYVAFSSMFNDSLFLYQKVNKVLVEKAITGEGVTFSKKTIKSLLPVLKLEIAPNDTATFYIKSVGIGQLNNLDGWLMNGEAYHVHDSILFMWHGIFYGILMVAFIINFAYYLLTNERAYAFFSLQVLGSIFVLLYFDGVSQKFIFPESGYWGNQVGAMALVITFLFALRFHFHFFEVKSKSIQDKILFWLGISTLTSGIFSFVHPWGFSIFVVSFSIITALIACFQIYLVYDAYKKNLFTYTKISISTICWVCLGAIFQLYTTGVLGDSFFIHHTIHFTFVIQAIFISLAIGGKLREIRERTTNIQKELNSTLMKHSQNLISTIESEKLRIASDIHDGIGQNLLVIRNKLLREQQMAGPEQQKSFNSLLKLTSEALEDARTISYQLRPPILNTFGISAAISALVNNFISANETEVVFSMPTSIDECVEKEHEINIYRILQEILNNSLKHSAASRILLTVEKQNDFLLINYEDDGKGFNPEKIISGLGFLNIKERLHIMNGMMEISTKIGEGTEISIQIPTVISNTTEL
jgi:two-component system, sensor histidine kinase LadS